MAVLGGGGDEGGDGENIWVAASDGDLDRVRQLLTRGVAVNARDELGYNPLDEAGATAIIQPGGSMRDAEVIAAADERGLAMVFTGIRHFRH